MFFRPEEIHPTSTVCPRLVERLIVMDDSAFWLTQQDIAVTHLHDDGFTTVRADCVYPD